MKERKKNSTFLHIQAMVRQNFIPANLSLQGYL